MALRLNIETEAQALAMEALDYLELYASGRQGSRQRATESIMTIGRAALAVPNYLVTSFALHKLAARCHALPALALPQAAIEFIALAGMFWVSVESGHGLIAEMLRNVAASLHTTEDVLLYESRRALVGGLDFEAADAVGQMCQSYHA